MILLQRIAWTLSTLLVVLVAPRAVSAETASGASISGRWKLVLMRPERRRKFQVVFQQEGTRVSGSVVDPRGKASRIEVGSFKDGKLAFQVKREFRGKPGVFTVAAELKDSGKIEGRLSRDGKDVGRVVLTRRVPPRDSSVPVSLEKLAGTWYAVAATPDGAKKDCRLVLSVKNGHLVGAFRLGKLSADLRDIRQKGGKILFAFSFRVNDVDTLVRIEAQLHDDGLLKGTWTAAGSESGAFTAGQPAAL